MTIADTGRRWPLGTGRRAHGIAALSFVALGAIACDAIIGIEDLHSNPNGPDPDPVQCQVPTDCPNAGNSCFLRSCEGGTCNVSEAPAGTEVASQVDGDCQIVLCNAEGIAEGTADPTDISPDGRECTDDLCGPDGARNTPAAPGTACSVGVCDGAGECVQCVGAAQCPGQICVMNVCVPATCGDMIKNGTETDQDCGGMCPPCGVGKDCLQPSDCTSKVCQGGTCQPPSCDDGVKNAQETDVDCGGGGPEPCPRCEDLLHCAMPSDCQSGVCQCEGQNCQPICQVPTCTDGIKNGTEVQPDCQGGCVGTCDPGEECEGPADCGSSVCEGGVCHDCTDMIQNVLETGIDCGGPVCPACG